MQNAKCEIENRFFILHSAFCILHFDAAAVSEGRA